MARLALEAHQPPGCPSRFATNDQRQAQEFFRLTNDRSPDQFALLPKKVTQRTEVVLYECAVRIFLLIARKAVGAVKKILTLCSAITRQKVPASGVRTGFPQRERSCTPSEVGHKQYKSDPPPSRHLTQPRKHLRFSTVQHLHAVL